jgi:hypothetical protein
MRHSQCILKASTVQAHASRMLMDELEMADYSPKLPARLVVSVLLLASLWQTSLSGACGMVKDRPGRETARKALYACLPSRPTLLLTRLLAALRLTVPAHLRRLPQVMALDLHQRPFYGNRKGRRKTRGTTKRQRKAGTRHSFTYATLAVLSPWGERLTVGLKPTRPHMRLTTIVEDLLRQAAELMGLSVSYLMLDKEFYSAEVVSLLQKAGVPFLMPAARKPSNEGLYDAGKSEVGWYDYGWTSKLMRWLPGMKRRRQRGTLTVRVKACVARNKDGEALVYVSWGMGTRVWSPAEVVRMYQRRFGIESSYRQMGQCLARTSSRNERYRLLLVGVALLLCNLWAWLHSEAFSTGALGETRLDLARMRLIQMRAGLAAHIASLFGGYIDHWIAQRPLPPELTHDS